MPEGPGWALAARAGFRFESLTASRQFCSIYARGCDNWTNLSVIAVDMSVPELVNALCHHLAARDDQPYTSNFASTKKVFRETLYKRYRDVAFSQLLGMSTGAARRRGTGWNGADDERPAEGRSNAQALDRLREMLLASNAGSAWGAARVHARHSVVVAETNGGFVFSCSEGARVYQFLELLATTWPEDDIEEELRAKRDAWSAHVGRGTLVEDPPNAHFVPGLVGLRDVVGCAEAVRLGISGADLDGEDRQIIPAARGWFDDTRGGNAHGSPGRPPNVTRNADQEHTPTTTPRTEQAKPFAYQPSRSPVKVPIGSLFMDRSPGKMTAFDPSGPCDDREELAGKLRQRNKARMDVLNQLDAISVSTAVDSSMFGRDTLSIVDRNPPPRIYKETVTFWNGEESEIAREALLALGGVRSSLSKLRGRLLMPQALPRPASAHILRSMVEASRARYIVEDFVIPIVKESDQRAGDPISHAFAHGLKHMLDGVNTDLLKVEMQDVNSWMQPVGLKLQAGVDACGAEYHGMGMSILQLAHATDNSRTSLLFLASYFGDSGDAVENRDGDTSGAPGAHDDPGKGAAGNACRSFPRGRALLEFLHASAQSCVDGPCAGIAHCLFLRSLAPYLSHVSRWAFGVEHLTAADTFAATLSSEYYMSALGDTLGPAHIPSFFSARMRRDLMVAGTQLRLLDAWKHGAMTHGADMEMEVSSFLIDAMQKIDSEGNMHGERGKGTESVPGTTRGRPESGSRWFTSDANLDPWNFGMPDTGDGDGSSSLLPAPPSSYPAPKAAVSTRRAIFEHILDDDARHVSISVLLECHIGGILQRQASLVSRACVRLFVDQQQLDSLSAIRFLRNALMGFAGDFSSEFVRALDLSILELEPMTGHKARAMVSAAASYSCLQDTPLSGHLTASLLPDGENAICLVEDAFSYSTEYSDAIRIKAPYMSSMAPMLVPPVGHAAYDCINVSFHAPGLLGAIISDDTMTAYSAIFSMNIRLRRALIALDTINRATLMGRHEKMKCARGDFRMPWAERYKTFKSFCLSCGVHLDGVAHMYLACCSGTAWETVERAEAEDIHSLIKIHKRYVYSAAGRIISACDSPAIKLGIESMLDAILELRDTIERAGGRAAPSRGAAGGVARGHAEPIFEDPTHWQNIKRLMLKYERGRLGTLNRTSRPLTTTERIRNDLLTSLAH